jgi:hypothetical protein
MRLPGRTSRQVGRDRLTVGLAVTAVASFGAVMAGEFRRRLRGRIAERDAGKHGFEHPVEAIQAAGQASQDTFLVAVEGYAGAPRRETVLFNLFSGITGAFVWARLSTAAIRSGWWPLGNVKVGGSHIHHFVPGIALAFGSGAAGLITQSQEVETALAIPFGVGVGLTFDEAALLLRLQDVYWTREGLLSVQVSLATVSVLGATILALRMLQQGERSRAEQGLLPVAD